MSEDELELDTLGDRKTALFVIISDTDDTFNFVVSIMYSQLFNLLCDKSQGIKQLMAGGGIVLIGLKLIPLLANVLK